MTQNYGVKGLIVAALFWFLTVFLAVFSSTTTIEQGRLKNMQTNCGMTFDTDEEGNLSNYKERLFYDTIVQDTFYFGLFGLYFGQVLFRHVTQSKLTHDAFCSESFFTV